MAGPQDEHMEASLAPLRASPGEAGAPGPSLRELRPATVPETADTQNRVEGGEV